MRPATDSPYMLLVAPVREERADAGSTASDGVQGIDKLKVAALDDPGDHARRLLGPRADRRRRARTALLPADEDASSDRPAAR